MNLKALVPTYKPLEKASSFDYKFTVFTPVYNRSETIHRVFESLEKQTFKDFELIIINDDSLKCLLKGTTAFLRINDKK